MGYNFVFRITSFPILRFSSRPFILHNMSEGILLLMTKLTTCHLDLQWLTDRKKENSTTALVHDVSAFFWQLFAHLSQNKQKTQNRLLPIKRRYLIQAVVILRAFNIS